MDYDFLYGFSPRLLDVVRREGDFWAACGYELYRERTRLHVLACVTEGRGLLELDGQRYALEAGAVFYVRPGQMMRITTRPEMTLDFYSIHFQYGMLRWEGSEARLEMESARFPLPSVLPRSGPSVPETFLDAYGRWQGKTIGYEWQAKLLFLQIVQLLAQDSERLQEPSSARAIQDAILYMKDHYREDVSRDTLAALVSLSPSYFSAAFKSYTGLSPVRYLTKIRLDRAKQLLKGTSLPIREVAEESGFPDSFYFARLFARETGMSPRQYRQS